MMEERRTLQPDEKESWDQLDGESAKAFAAFNAYLDLPMAERTLPAARKKLEKPAGYDRLLATWKSTYQWRTRSQAFDAAQLEKQREVAEQARLEIYATGFTLGTYFFEHVGEDLKRQWEDTQINPKTGEEEPYKKPNSFSIDQKLKMLNWAYDMAIKNAVERKSVLLEIGAKALKDNAFDEALDEVIAGDPKLHDAYCEIISRALRRANGEPKPESKKKNDEF